MDEFEAKLRKELHDSMIHAKELAGADTEFITAQDAAKEVYIRTVLYLQKHKENGMNAMEAAALGVQLASAVASAVSTFTPHPQLLENFEHYFDITFDVEVDHEAGEIAPGAVLTETEDK